VRFCLLSLAAAQLTTGNSRTCSRSIHVRLSAYVCARSYLTSLQRYTAFVTSSFRACLLLTALSSQYTLHTIRRRATA
jgi:hypothetical protein